MITTTGLPIFVFDNGPKMSIAIRSNGPDDRESFSSIGSLFVGHFRYRIDIH